MTITLRTPGALRTSSSLMQVRDEALDALLAECAARQWSVRQQETYDGPTGPEATAPVADATPSEVKALEMELERTRPLGALWNLDVHSASGPLIRRDLGLPQRRCLVCSRPAGDCARSLRHPQAELDAAVLSLLAASTGKVLAQDASGLK